MLTISPSMLCTGGVSAKGSVCLGGGGSAPGGVCLGGVCSWECLLRGGVCLLPGVCVCGIPACTEADTTLLTE